jgi:hypothetical protein
MIGQVHPKGWKSDRMRYSQGNLRELHLRRFRAEEGGIFQHDLFRILLLWITSWKLERAFSFKATHLPFSVDLKALWCHENTAAMHEIILEASLVASTLHPGQHSLSVTLASRDLSSILQKYLQRTPENPDEQRGNRNRLD